MKIKIKWVVNQFKNQMAQKEKEVDRQKFNRFTPFYMSLIAIGVSCILYYGFKEDNAFSDLFRNNFDNIDIIPAIEESRKLIKKHTQ